MKPTIKLGGGRPATGRTARYAVAYRCLDVDGCCALTLGFSMIDRPQSCAACGGPVAEENQEPSERVYFDADADRIYHGQCHTFATLVVEVEECEVCAICGVAAAQHGGEAYEYCPRAPESDVR